MIAPTATPAVAYLRRSTDKQEQSIDDQRAEIGRYAREHGFQVVGEYTDDAISGTSADKRPGFQRMVADAPAGGFRAVIVWNSDRFSRADAAETAALIAALDRRLAEAKKAEHLDLAKRFTELKGQEASLAREVRRYQQVVEDKSDRLANWGPVAVTTVLGGIQPGMYDSSRGGGGLFE